MVLITTRLPRGATLESAMRTLNLTAEEVDTASGLVPIDPDEGLYALRVTEKAGHRVSAQTGPGEGPYSDPRIEPYGPPQ